MHNTNDDVGLMSISQEKKYMSMVMCRIKIESSGTFSVMFFLKKGLYKSVWFQKISIPSPMEGYWKFHGSGESRGANFQGVWG